MKCDNCMKEVFTVREFGVHNYCERCHKKYTDERRLKVFYIPEHMTLQLLQGWALYDFSNLPADAKTSRVLYDASRQAWAIVVHSLEFDYAPQCQYLPEMEFDEEVVREGDRVWVKRILKATNAAS